jgi:hypothetical protein
VARDGTQSAPNRTEQIPSRPSAVAPTRERGDAPEELLGFSAVPVAEPVIEPVPGTVGVGEAGVGEGGVGVGPGPYELVCVPEADVPDGELEGGAGALGLTLGNNEEPEAESGAGSGALPL